MKKKRQNRNRRKKQKAAKKKPTPQKPIESDAPPDEMVDYIQMMTSLIEERDVSRNETVAMLDEVVRQHSMSKENELDYAMRFLKENPPKERSDDQRNRAFDDRPSI